MYPVNCTNIKYSIQYPGAIAGGIFAPSPLSVKMSTTETRYREKLSPETVENRHENHTNGFPCAQTNENKASTGKQLHKLEEVPEYLRFNPFVKDGYRRQMNVKECCQSLLFFHNETVNIYTHGKFICCFVYFTF